MQAILTQLLAERGDGWREVLSGIGFSTDQARRFLPASLEALVARVEGGGLDLAALLGKLHVPSILAQLDVGALASRAGVDEAQATEGLKSLLPEIVKALGAKAGLAKSLGADGSDLLGRAKGLFGG